jgi:head-tail adaptor
MTEFSPSDRRHRLTLEQLSRVADEGGGFTESWVTVATLSADLRPIGGDERYEADRLAGRITHR